MSVESCYRDVGETVVWEDWIIAAPKDELIGTKDLLGVLEKAQRPVVDDQAALMDDTVELGVGEIGGRQVDEGPLNGLMRTTQPVVCTRWKNFPTSSWRLVLNGFEVIL